MAPAAPDKRVCLRCQTCVVDLTAKSDAEVRAYARQTGGRFCGRLTARQRATLSRAPADATSGSSSWSAVVLAFVGLGLAPGPEAKAQPVPAPPATYVAPAGGESLRGDERPPAPAPARDVPSDTVYVLRGQVVDACDGAPLPGATVSIDNRSGRTRADDEGWFELALSSDPANTRRDTLVVSFVGYVAREIPLAEAQAASPLFIRLELDDMELAGEVLIVRAPLHKRVWCG